MYVIAYKTINSHVICTNAKVWDTYKISPKGVFGIKKSENWE